MMLVYQFQDPFLANCIRIASDLAAETMLLPRQLRVLGWRPPLGKVFKGAELLLAINGCSMVAIHIIINIIINDY